MPPAQTAQPQDATTTGREREKLPEFIQTHLRIPGKTVYILGSGFSRPLNVPVIRDFLPVGLQNLKAEAWLANRPAEDKTRELLEKVGRIADRYRRVLNAIADGMATIEQLFCLVDLIGEEDERRDLARFIRAVCEQAWKLHLSQSGPKPKVGRSHFFSGPWKASGGALEVCLYEAFLSQVLFRPQTPFPPWSGHLEIDPTYAMNAIISFNYDLVVERKLSDLVSRQKPEEKILPYYGRDVDPTWGKFPERLVLPIVKIHGSLNWKSTDGVAIEVCNDPESAADAPFVFPSWQRSKLTGTVFGLLARDARAHLRLAERWVFIGYSMPTTDLYFQYLLADALDTPELPTIEVVDPVPFEDARARLRRMIGQRGESLLLSEKLHHAGLDAYVTRSRSSHSFPADAD